MFWFSFRSNLQVYHLYQVRSFAWCTLHISSPYPWAIWEPISGLRQVFPHRFFTLWWHFYTNATCRTGWWIVDSFVLLNFLSFLFTLWFSCIQLFSTYVTKIMSWTLVCVFLWFRIAFSSFIIIGPSAVDGSSTLIFGSKSSNFLFGWILYFSILVTIIFVLFLHWVPLDVSQFIFF